MAQFVKFTKTVTDLDLLWLEVEFVAETPQEHTNLEQYLQGYAGEGLKLVNGNFVLSLRLPKAIVGSYPEPAAPEPEARVPASVPVLEPAPTVDVKPPVVITGIEIPETDLDLPDAEPETVAGIDDRPVDEVK